MAGRFTPCWRASTRTGERTGPFCDRRGIFTYARKDRQTTQTTHGSPGSSVQKTAARYIQVLLPDFGSLAPL